MEAGQPRTPQEESLPGSAERPVALGDTASKSARRWYYILKLDYTCIYASRQTAKSSTITPVLLASSSTQRKPGLHPKLQRNCLAACYQNAAEVR